MSSLGRPVVAVYERRGTWVRRLRPRLGASIRWRETRSANEFVDALLGLATPIGLIDLGQRPEEGLESLARGVPRLTDPLILVLDPAGARETAGLARELGASLVLGGVITPPDVESLLRRWLDLTRERGQRLGWSASAEPDPDDPIHLLDS